MTAHVHAGPGGLTTLRAVPLEALPLDAERAAEARVWMAFWPMAVAHPRLRGVQSAGYREWRELVARLLIEAAECGEVAADLDTGSISEQLTGRSRVRAGAPLPGPLHHRSAPPRPAAGQRRGHES